MSREIIIISEKMHRNLMHEKFGYLDNNEDYNNPDFELVDKTIDKVNYGKGMGTIEFVIVRLSDNKYFKGECYAHSDGYTSMDEAHGYTIKIEYKLKEVFKKAITTYIYE